MSQAVRIEKQLRCLRTPGICGEQKFWTGTNPQSSLKPQLDHRGSEDQTEYGNRPDIFFCLHVVRRRAVAYPRASRHSARLRLRQVNIGVSRRVKQLAFVSRNSWNRSRKTAGLLGLKRSP